MSKYTEFKGKQYQVSMGNVWVVVGNRGYYVAPESEVAKAVLAKYESDWRVK